MTQAISCPEIRRMVIPSGPMTLQWPPGAGLLIVGVLHGVARLKAPMIPAVAGTSRAHARATTVLYGDLVQSPEGSVLHLVCEVLSDAAVFLSVIVPRQWLIAVLGLADGDLPSLDCPSLERIGYHDPVTVLTLAALWAGRERGARQRYLDAAAHHLAAHLVETRLDPGPRQAPGQHDRGAPFQHAEAAQRAAPGAIQGTHPVLGMPFPLTVEAPQGKERLNNAQLDEIIRYARQHIAEPITLDQLAAVAGYSRYHFLRRFAATTGRTPHRFLTDLRIGIARIWLESSADDSVAYIGGQCGFPTAQHFSRVFRQRTGTTPAQYRRDRRGSTA